MKYIVVTGSPTEGFNFTGVFNSHQEALDYAKDLGREFSWWIASVYEPEI